MRQRSGNVWIPVPREMRKKIVPDPVARERASWLLASSRQTMPRSRRNSSTSARLTSSNGRIRPSPRDRENPGQPRQTRAAQQAEQDRLGLIVARCGPGRPGRRRPLGSSAKRTLGGRGARPVPDCRPPRRPLPAAHRNGTPCLAASAATNRSSSSDASPRSLMIEVRDSGHRHAQLAGPIPAGHATGRPNPRRPTPRRPRGRRGHSML